MPKPRTFSSLGECVQVYAYLLMRPIAALKLMLGIGFDPKFRERLMLAVTQVNKCSFCTWFHTREALRVGLEEGEIKSLLGAEFANVPEEQRAAVLFAQHWAETRRNPDAEVKRNFEAEYTPHELKMIYLSLYAITIGNYTGGFLERIFSVKRKHAAEVRPAPTEKRP